MTTDHYDREALIDYLHGALEPEADAAAFAHLEACTACTAVYEDEAAFGESLRAAARADELEFPSMIKARVWDTVRRQQPSWLERLRAWGPRIAVPVAAVIAIAAYIAPGIHGIPAAGITAGYLLDEHNAAAQQNPFGPGVAPEVGSDNADGGSAVVATYIESAQAATLDDPSGAAR